MDDLAGCSVKQRIRPLRVAVSASRRAWRSRKRMADARAADPIKKPRIGYEAILAASQPGISSAVIAKQFGLSPAYVRKVWQRANLPKRASGKHPEHCAWKTEPSL